MTEGSQPANLPLALVVLVSGPPAVGKATLARRLAADLGYPCLTKDDIKEALFDTIGCQDLDWSRKLGAATFEILYIWAEAELAARRSFVLESNFHPEFPTTRFLALRRKYPYTPVQIQCRAEGETLVARFDSRAASGSRHPGHFDRERMPDLASSLHRGYYDDLEIGGRVLHVDMTDFDRLDYPELLAAVREVISPRTAAPRPPPATD